MAFPCSGNPSRSCTLPPPTALPLRPVLSFPPTVEPPKPACGLINGTHGRLPQTCCSKEVLQPFLLRPASLPSQILPPCRESPPSDTCPLRLAFPSDWHPHLDTPSSTGYRFLWHRLPLRTFFPLGPSSSLKGPSNPHSLRNLFVDTSPLSERCPSDTFPFSHLPPSHSLQTPSEETSFSHPACTQRSHMPHPPFRPSAVFPQTPHPLGLLTPAVLQTSTHLSHTI